MEDPPPLLNGEAAYSGNRNNAAKDGAREIQEVEVSNKDVNQVKHGGENGREGAIDEDENMVEPDDAIKDDFSCGNLVGAADVDTSDTEHDDNIESANVEIACEESACQEEYKEEKDEHGPDVKEVEGDVIKMFEVKAYAGNEEVTENVKKEDKLDKAEEKQNDSDIQVVDAKVVDKEDSSLKIDQDGMCEDTQDAIKAECDGVKMVEAETDACNEYAKENRKKGKKKVKIEDKIDETNIHAEDEGMSDDGPYVMATEGEDNNMVEEKAVARDAEVVETEKKEDVANIPVQDEKMGDEEDGFQMRDNEGMSEDVKGVKVYEDANIKMNETRIVAIEPEIKEIGKEETEDKAQEESSSIQSDDMKMVGAYPKEDKEKHNEDSYDTKEAEGEEIKVTVEAVTIAQNAVVQEEKKEAKEDKPIYSTTNAQAGDVNIVSKEDSCQMEDKERKAKCNQETQAADNEDYKMVGTKADAINYGATEIRNQEEKEGATEEKQKDNNEETICIKKQDKDKMMLLEKDKKETGVKKQEGSEGRTVDVVDKQEISEREQRSMEKQEGLTEEEKDVMDKQELNDGEQSVVDEEEIGNVDNQEVDDRKQTVEKLYDEFIEEEKNGASKHEVRHEQTEAAEKQEEVRQQEGEPSAKKKEEEQLDGKGTIEKRKDEKYDGKVMIEKKVELCEKESIEKKEEDQVGEKGASEKEEEMETQESTSEKERKDAQIDDIHMQEGQNKGTKRSHPEKEGADQDDESDQNMVKNTDEISKQKKARTVGEKEHGKHCKQDGSKSREATDLLCSQSSYSLDRPARERRMVQRFVEVMEVSDNNFVVDKGYGIPLKNITSVADKIKTKKSSELKFLHQLLFGRRGKAVDFQNHILQFSGFVWYESDEKQRAKMKEKLNNCSIDTLFDLCDLLAIPIVSKANSRKGDIVGKLLDFIVKPHAMDGTTLYDEQESNCRKRKRGGESGTKDLEGARERSVKVAQRFHDEQTTSKRHNKYSESESADEGHEEDESMNSDNKEIESYDEEAKDEDENDYSSRNGNTRSKCLKKVSSSSKTFNKD
ncbi:hypothetical protein QOZ80_3AG0225870 [Eleusine coracana subsp. coracana]|nr:hypothetical protein QOZ80_3AG0225870 [Eleusine coracana subsp. coracana]